MNGVFGMIDISNARICIKTLQTFQPHLLIVKTSPTLKYAGKAILQNTTCLANGMSDRINALSLILIVNLLKLLTLVMVRGFVKLYVIGKANAINGNFLPL